jgi:CRISPR-associated endoribonuclease Cas6
MRVKLLLSIVQPEKQSVLPINYQYEFSSWFRRNFSRPGSPFLEFLDKNGGSQIVEGGFRLFCFSNPYIPKLHQVDDRLVLKCQAISIILSLLDYPGLSYVLMDQFLNQRFSIGDSISSVDFQVTELKFIPDPEFSSHMSFKTISPILISASQKSKSDWNPVYLNPFDPAYPSLFLDHLWKIYGPLALTGQRSKNTKESSPGKIQIFPNPKSRLITIKANTRDETKIRGYLYSFSITAPAELIRLGYILGFGEMGSLGFGCTVPIINGLPRIGAAGM